MEQISEELDRRIKYYSGIKRYIASRIRNPDDAEDVTQSVFVELYHKSDLDDNHHNTEAYLFGIARNLIANYYRQKKKKQKILRLNPKIADNVAFSDYSSDSKTRYLAEEIKTVVLELPPKAREAVKLRLIDDLNPQEAAQKIGCSVDRFYERFHEGVKIIKNHMIYNPLIKKELFNNRRKT